MNIHFHKEEILIEPDNSNEQFKLGVWKSTCPFLEVKMIVGKVCLTVSPNDFEDLLEDYMSKEA